MVELTGELGETIREARAWQVAHPVYDDSDMIEADTWDNDQEEFESHRRESAPVRLYEHSPRPGLYDHTAARQQIRDDRSSASRRAWR